MTDTSQFKLIIEDDEGRRSVVPVELGEVSIGRLEGNTIRLKERNVSRRHARLMRSEDGAVVAEDLDSYNGLWINGDRITGRVPLHDGDLLRIGDFQLELRGAGLLKRAEETTQRTHLASDTQPGIQAGEMPEPMPPPPTVRPSGGPSPSPTAKALFSSSETTNTDPDGRPSGLANENTGVIMRQGGDEDVNRRGSMPLLPPYAKLICVSTQYAGREYDLMQVESVIGRTDDNQVGIDHRSVSRQHAKIVLSKGRYRIIDLGSANGTLVNGEVYAQVELKKADLIELGHVKLRFVPPGEDYVLTAEEQAEVAGGPRLAKWIRQLRHHLGLLLGLSLSIVAAALVGTWLIMNAGNERNSTALAPPPPPAADGLGNDEASRLLLQAKHALPLKQWKRAQSMGAAALELDPMNEEAKALVRAAEAELKAENSYETAEQAAGQNNWSDAFNALQEVPKESSYAHQAQTLMAQVKPNLAAERVADCRTALKNEDWDDAELLVEELQDLDPDRHDIAELKAAIDEGRKKHGSKPGAAHPTHVKKEPKSKAVPAPLPSHEPPPEDAKVLYADGTKALNAGLFAKAIELFNRCMMADKNYSMCYRAMGIAYAKSGNGPKAVRYYRLYLKVEPNARDAPQVRQLLQQYEAASVTQAPPGQ